ncbi:hypothetical protein COCOBI_04-0220 [Coccomyxa sp. Obi]|nr:hypothetical protein COCOBI_04-0220 [Coccomyxa sp. Obi]
MAALGADAEQASCKANPRHTAFIGDSAPSWLLDQSSSLPEWEGSIPTFTQVLAELDKPQPFSLAAWAAGRGRLTAAPSPLPSPKSLRDSAAEAMPCARRTADEGSQQGRQGIADQPCFPPADVATPDDYDHSVESSLAGAQGTPALQPAAAESQKSLQQFLSPHRPCLTARPQWLVSASPGKENHGGSGRRASLFAQNTLAGRLKAAAGSCRRSSPAGHHEQALGCASLF